MNVKLLTLLTLLPASLYADEVTPTLPSTDQTWTGADLWANPMEDWQTKDSKATNTHSGGDRELVILTAEINDKLAPLKFSATFDSTQETDLKSTNGFLGFQLGLQGQFNDYRDSAIYGSGFATGVLSDGKLFIGGSTSEKPLLKIDGTINLTLTATPNKEGKYDLTLTANDATFTNENVHPSWLPGLASVTASAKPQNKTIIRSPRPERVPTINQGRGGKWHAAISNISLSGEKITAHPDRSFGPIFWTQFTVESNGNLNLIVQLAPVGNTLKQVTLQVEGQPATTQRINLRSRVAEFHMNSLDTSKAHPYTIKWGNNVYKGTIPAEPTNKKDLTVAALSCNDATGFPHNQLVQNVKSQNPDVIAFMGDQIYEPIGGYSLIFGDNNTKYDDRTFICYLRKYAMHGWSWRELLRDTPAFALPDDHDMFHGNIWGEGGKLADRSGGIYAGAQDSGGYKMSVGFVNAVHQTQTGSLPKPVDPKPTPTGISVYFTNWKYAGIDMAILADRQWKSAPKALLPESKINNGWPQNHAKQRPALTNPRELDHPKAELLGPRQEKFLTTWGSNTSEKSDWRLVISATPLMTLQSIPEDKFSDGVVPSLPKMKPGQYPETDIPKLDYDSNGWPQGKRDLAVDLITKAHAVHVTGDQHLGSTGQYGTAKFNTSAWWISSPAIANLWPRRWFPKDGGANRLEGAPKYTGEFEDGFGNKITLHAASNPYDIDKEPSRLYDKAVGYAVLTLHRDTGYVTLANWPYYAGPSNKTDNTPYTGWPITIDPKTNKRIK